MSFVERFIILCPYLGEPTIGDSTVFVVKAGGGPNYQHIGLKLNL